MKIFLKIFGGFKFIEGSPKGAFENPDNIVLSEKTARKIFGDQPALGKILICDKYFKETYTVGGVIRIQSKAILTLDLSFQIKIVGY